MEKYNLILENGTSKEVDALFYLYNSKYYFMYTEREIDEAGYVILYLVQVGKEVIRNEFGNVETGAMVGVEIKDPTEWVNVQQSVTKIVQDKKNGTTSSDIRYLPISMLTKLKIVSKNRFRLMKMIMKQYFGLEFEAVEQSLNQVEVEPLNTPDASLNTYNNEDTNSVNTSTVSNITPEIIQNSPSMTDNLPSQDISTVNNDSNALNNDFSGHSFDSVGTLNTPNVSDEDDSNVIINYKSKYFEEVEKNKELEAKISELTNKINNIKELIG